MLIVYTLYIYAQFIMYSKVYYYECNNCVIDIRSLAFGFSGTEWSSEELQKST